MKETLYDKIQYSADFFSKLVLVSITNAVGHEIPEFPEEDPYPEIIISEDTLWTDVDTLKVMYEIDMFVRENPNTYVKYLKRFYAQYEWVQEWFMKYINAYPTDIDSMHFLKFSNYAERIMDHIQNILCPVKKDEEQPNLTVKLPKGRPNLSREASILLFFELRESRIIAQPTNQVLAEAMAMITGYSKKQIQDIIRSPGTDVIFLGKDNNGLKKETFKELISALEDLTERVKKHYRGNQKNNEFR